MRRNILFRLLGVIITLLGFMPLQAQDNDQYAVFNFRNDGNFNAFLNFEIDSITYSCIDTLGIEHDEVVVQEVWTQDSLYRIPIDAIDSLSFHAPAPKMRDNLFYLRDYHADNTVSIDSLTLCFSPIIHRDSIPSVGQVLLSVTEKTPYEEGFAGRVLEINRLDDRIEVVCMQVSPCDVFERLVLVGMGASDTEGYENMVNARRAIDAGGGDGGGGSIDWDKYDLEKIKLPDWLKHEWKIEFLDLVSITSKNPEVYYKYYANVDAWTFDIGGDLFVYHPDLTYNVTFDWDKISKLGEEYKGVKEIWNLFKEGDFESVIAKDKQKLLEEEQWEKKLPIPFKIGPFNCVFEMGVMMKPEAFDIKAEWEMKTTTIHHIGFITKGYNTSIFMYASPAFPSYMLVDDLFDITEVDKDFDWIQECNSTKLDVKIDGSFTFGAFLRLKANLLTKYLVRTCVSAEAGLKLSYNGQINIKETDYNTKRAYGLLKDTNVGGKVYVKVKGEEGALPFDLINLSREMEIPLIEGNFYFVPHFTKPVLTSQFGSKRMDNEMFTTTVSKTLFPFISCYPGLGIYSKGLFEDWDIEEVLFYDDEPYKTTWDNLVQNIVPDWKPDRDIQFSVFGIDLKAGETYRCYPVFRMFGKTWRGEPYTEFTYPKPLSLEQYGLVLRKDDTWSVRVNGGWGDYDLKCEQEGEVVNAEFVTSGNFTQVHIKALNKGTATLKVRDKRTLETETIEVKVYDEPEDGTDISVSQEDLDFGTLAYGEELTIPLKITNHGTNTLYYNIPYGVPAGFTLGNQPEFTVLEPGESWTYLITATGTSADNWRFGTIYIFSNATKDPVPIGLKVKGKSPYVKYVDLGLSVKWAECNLGAFDSGDGLNRYFAWGECDSKTTYGWGNYKYCDGTALSCEQLGEIAGTDYDAAHHLWGGKWRMPTDLEMKELIRECTWEWDNSLALIGGPVGYQVIGPNGQQIFLEANGVFDDTEIDGENKRGVYLTSSQSVVEKSNAYVLQFEKGDHRIEETPRYLGIPIRPVYDENIQTGCLKVEPTSIDFGEVEVGKSASQPFILTNTGTGTLNVTIDDSEFDVFSVAESSQPLSLEAGKSRSFMVTFTPKDEKTTVGSITFSTDVNSEQLKLGLQGKGIPATEPHTPAALEAVDLGLHSGTLWANMNVGAESPEDYGGYYAWGETEEKDVYDWSTYIHCDGTKETCHNLGEDITGTEYDVAHVKWGGNWQMPTYYQFWELLINCSSKWTTNNGVSGRLYTGPNGNSIFLPTAGFLKGDINENVGTNGDYWSSTPYLGNSFEALVIYFYSGHSSSSQSFCCYGHTVRPVITPQKDKHHVPAALEAIDLGLPSGTKWANMNVGAEYPEDCGDYYAWGETEEKYYYASSTYAYYEDGSYIDIGSDIAGTEYDVAHVNWGGDWQMPTLDQIKELLDNCTYTWTTVNGVKGGEFTGPNGNSIFLPAASYFSNFSIDQDVSGIYLSSTQDLDKYYNNYSLVFNKHYAKWGFGVRYNGRSVRPVVRN